MGILDLLGCVCHKKSKIIFKTEDDSINHQYLLFHIVIDLYRISSAIGMSKYFLKFRQTELLLYIPFSHSQPTFTEEKESVQRCKPKMNICQPIKPVGAFSNGVANTIIIASQITVKPLRIHRNTPRICVEFARISDI